MENMGINEFLEDMKDTIKRIENCKHWRNFYDYLDKIRFLCGIFEETVDEELYEEE